MKYIILGLISIFVINAQKYYTKTGHTEFRASVKAFEEVAAVNKSTSAIFNTETGDVASLLFIRAFRFKIALMEEHFNENYMDSNEFPKAMFKGRISDFNIKEISNKPYKCTGTLTIHGVSSEVETTVLIEKNNTILRIKSRLIVKPETFGIEIPSIVRDKIAKEIIIGMIYDLKRK